MASSRDGSGVSNPICCAAIFLVAALSFDLGRRASTQTELQSFADNVALAAAGVKRSSFAAGLDNDIRQRAQKVCASCRAVKEDRRSVFFIKRRRDEEDRRSVFVDRTAAGADFLSTLSDVIVEASSET